MIIDNKEEYIKKIAEVDYDPKIRYWDEQLKLAEIFVNRLEAAGLIKFKNLD